MAVMADVEKAITPTQSIETSKEMEELTEGAPDLVDPDEIELGDDVNVDEEELKDEDTKEDL
jgi:hypothetical protein